MKLYFVTSNRKKFEEVERILKVPMHQISIDILEPQGTPVEIVSFKLAEAQKHLISTGNKDNLVLVDDTFFHMNGLYGFPGPYAKDFLKIGYDAIIDISEKVGKDAKVVTYLGLFYKNQIKIFEEFYDCQVGPYNTINDIFDFDCITFYEGSRISDLNMEEKGKISARGNACRKLWTFLEKENVLSKLE